MNVVLCSVAAEGHVRPMLAVARGLLDRGWRVRFLTGARFAGLVERAGAEFIPLPADADTLDRLDRTRRRSRLAVLNEEMQLAFLDPAPGQARALLDTLAAEPADAVLAESTFIGVAALQSLPADERPPYVLCGIIPLGLPSVDVAPFGLGLTPLPGPVGRLRNRSLTWLATRVILRQAHAGADRTLRELGADGLHGRFLTSGQRNADLIAQFTVESFEYPRSDAPEHLVYVGPMTRTRRHEPTPDDPPIVHVTQGTLANSSWTELVAPALEGLADLPVKVLVATGGRALDTLPPLPENATAVTFLDYPEGAAAVQRLRHQRRLRRAARRPGARPADPGRGRHRGQEGDLCPGRLGRRGDQPAHRSPHPERHPAGGPADPGRTRVRGDKPADRRGDRRFTGRGRAGRPGRGAGQPVAASASISTRNAGWTRPLTCTRELAGGRAGSMNSSRTLRNTA